MLKIKHMKDNRYTVNGMVVLARTYKKAIKEYLDTHGAGSKVYLATKG